MCLAGAVFNKLRRKAHWIFRRQTTRIIPRRKMQFFSDQADQLVVGDISGGGDDYPTGKVILLHVFLKNGPVEANDICGMTHDRPAKRLTAPEMIGEQFVNAIGRSLVNFPDLLDDHRFFTFDIRLADSGIHQNIGQDINRQFNVFIENKGMKTGLLTGSKRI